MLPRHHLQYTRRLRRSSHPVVNVKNDVRCASASVPRRTMSDYPHLPSYQRMMTRLGQYTLRTSSLL